MNLRLLALTVALPLAVASAGPVGHGSADGAASSSSGRSAHASSLRSEPTARRSPLGLITSARCGPELLSPDGIEAQTCVMTQGRETWARTYYRNATGTVLDAVLSFMGPGGRTVQMHCPVGAGDEPDSCETPREITRGTPAGYTAVAEFAARRGSGPLLLRSGSNSGETTGS